MKLFIVTDLEGVAGAERWDQTYADGPYRPQTMKQLAKEVNAAIEGILEVDSGAEIEVLDGHGPGGLFKEDLHLRARYLRDGRPHAQLDPSYAALLFVDFMLSPEGQELIHKRNRVPASTAVQTSLNKFPFHMIDPVVVLDEQQKWEKIWSELFLKGQAIQREKD